MTSFTLNFLLVIISLYSPSKAVEYCDQGRGECKEMSATGCSYLFYNQHIIGAGIKYCDEENNIVCCPLPLNFQKRPISPSDVKLKRFERAVEYCDQGTGECKEMSGCSFLFDNLHIIEAGIKYCDKKNDIVCCPLPLNLQRRPNSPSDAKLKRFERECLRYNQLRPDCGSTPLILGGSKAAGKEFPFMARLGRRIPGNSEIKWECGGTLIHPKFVLTAAHCLFTTETKEQILNLTYPCPKFVVRLGELDFNSTTEDAQPQDFGVANYVPHPSYDEGDDESRHHDIALIELLQEATINEYISPACLPSSSGDDHNQFMATGWGFTRNAGHPSMHLLKVSLERFTYPICQERIEFNIDVRTQFCAGSHNQSGIDTCNGDSGGPMFVQHPKYNCLKQIIGITSYGLLCGEKGLPSVYTKVHLFNSWIENIIWGE